MNCEGFIAILLAFTACVGAQPAFVPRSDRELEKHREGKIVFIDSVGKGNLSKEDLDILENFEEESTEEHAWRPEIVLLFLNKFLRPKGKRITNLVQNLSLTNGKCFMARNSFTNRALTLCCDTPANCLRNETEKLVWISGCIIPKALPTKTHVDVIFPNADMFQQHNELFHGTPAANKESFEKYFHWSKDIPIKLAIIFSRRAYGDNSSNKQMSNGETPAEHQGKEVYRWLKSLPEGEQMHVFTVAEQRIVKKAATGNDKDIAVVLFGGDAMLVDSLTVKHENRSEYAMRTKDELQKWKADVIDRWPQDFQRIAFWIKEHYFFQILKTFNQVFDDIPLVNVPSFRKSTTLKSLFIIVGIPKLC